MTRVIQYIIVFALAALLAPFVMRTVPERAAVPDYENAKVFYEPFEPTANPFRASMWLNGEWQFRIEGEKEYQAVAVPHSWNNIPGLENYYGKANYSVNFTLPEDWIPGDSVLHFGAVPGTVAVIMNGTPVAKGVNEWFPFEVNVGCCVIAGEENTLELEIDGSGLNAAEYDEKKFMGVLGEVRIEQQKSLVFRDVMVETAAFDGATASLKVSVVIDIPQSDMLHIVGEIDRPVGKAVTFDTALLPDSDKTILVDFEIDVGDIQLWTPENPTLYKVSVVGIHESGMADGISRTFGIRFAEFVDGSLLVNNEPTPLNGIIYHRQYGNGQGPIISEKQIAQDISYIARAGFNAIKLTEPPIPALLDLCDETGMLVVAELTVPEKSFSEQQIIDRVDRFISTVRLHPSVIAIGFDFGDSMNKEIASAFARETAKAVPGLAVYVNEVAGEFTGKSDMGLNAVALTAELPSKIRAQFKKASRLVEKEKGATFIVTSAGAAGSPFRPKKVGLPASELNQLYIVGLMDDLVNESGSAAGWFVDSYSDYYSSTVLPDGSALLRERGIMTLDRAPKLTYEQLAGLAYGAPDISWARFPFVLSYIELAVLLVLVVICVGVWTGAGGVIPALLEPDLAWPSDGSWKNILGGLAIFGVPLLLSASLCASFAAAPSFDSAATGSLDAPSSIINYALSFMGGAADRTIFFLVLQAAMLALASIVASLFVGGEPLTVFEVFSRSLSLRLIYLLIPFIPVPAIVILAAVLFWEVLLQSGALARGFGLGPASSFFLVAFSHIFAIIFTALIFIHRFGQVESLLFR